MKYEKLLSKFVAKKSNNGYVAVALVAGLAAGAILSLLFAPESGQETRKLISNRAKGVGDGIKDQYTALKNKIVGEAEELAPETQVPHFTHQKPKKRKSAMREMVSDPSHAEQPDES